MKEDLENVVKYFSSICARTWYFYHFNHFIETETAKNRMTYNLKLAGILLHSVHFSG